MIPFGSAAGGRLGTIGLGTARDIGTYAEMVGRGEKPLSRITSSPLSADRGGFSHELDVAMERLQLPDMDKWPVSHRDSGRKLLAQWKEAGLLVDSRDGNGMSLTCAGFFWSDRLRKLLTDLVAAPVAG